MKREKLLSTHSVKFIFTLVMFITSCLAVSCNNLGSINRLPSSTNTAVGTDTNEGAGGAFQLDNVLPSQSAASSYDLVGEGSQFDTFCQDTANPNTKCQCQFSFTQTNVGAQITTSPITYQESNLVRCTSAVPSGISTFYVAVVTLDGNYASNQLSVDLNNGTFSGSTSYLDLSSALSFTQVQRYQCRKNEFIANPMDPNTIDPFQSEDPHINYPFNYYTTNVADSLVRLQQTGNQNWSCTLTGNQDGSLPPWANPIVFSAAPCTSTFCSGDQSYMYPTTSLVSGKIPSTNPKANGKRRASFWLAKQAYGAFTVAVQANVAPNDYVSSLTDTIGYAALPIPDANGSSSCPAITLPAKATWVKLWNFSANNISSPSKVTGSQSTTQSAIVCNSGLGLFPSCDIKNVGGTRGYNGSAPATAVFANSLATIGTSTISSPTTMAGRVALFTSSSTVTTGGASPSTFSACYNEVPSSWVTGGSSWIASPYSGPSASITYSTMVGFPWNLYSAITQNSCTDADSKNYVWPTGCGGSQALAAATPYDTQLTTAAIATNNYADELFVVTDPAQNDSVIKNGGVSQYIPVTFRAAADCPGPALCATNANAQQILWQVVSSANPVPTATPTSSPTATAVTNSYPLCVVQFYD